MYRKFILALSIGLIVGLVTFGVLFISGDVTKYHYKVEIRRCYSQSIEILEFDARGKKSQINTYKEAIPVLYVGEKKIVDVCDYKILEQREIE